MKPAGQTLAAWQRLLLGGTVEAARHPPAVVGLAAQTLDDPLVSGPAGRRLFLSHAALTSPASCRLLEKGCGRCVWPLDTFFQQPASAE